MENYPANHSHPFFAGKEFTGGVAHGLTFTDVLDRMWLLTGDRKYCDYAAFLYRDYSGQFTSETDVQLHNILDTGYRLKAHGVHTYEHLRPLITATWATGDPGLQEALEIYCGRIRQCTTPAGGAIGDEWIGGRTADATNTGYEYCSLHELMDSYTLLFRKSGDPFAADAMENIFFNAAQGSRHPEQSCIAYLKTDNSYEMTGTRNGEPEPGRLQTRYKYSPAHQDVAVCCAPNAGRITPAFVASTWLREDPHTLVCVSPAPVILRTEINGIKVTIETVTSYPYDNRLLFNIHCAEPVRMKLKIRKPGWVEEVETDEKFPEEGQFMVIDRLFNRENRLDLTWTTGVRVDEDVNHTKYFMHGALVYARPIEARMQTGREYAPGFTDLEYKPAEAVRYRYMDDHHAAFNEGKISLQLKNMQTGKTETTELIPISRTILRQAGF
jgi:phenolic acid decarboxylase